jgi:hypothetical protein
MKNIYRIKMNGCAYFYMIQDHKTVIFMSTPFQPYRMFALNHLEGINANFFLLYDYLTGQVFFALELIAEIAWHVGYGPIN